MNTNCRKYKWEKNFKKIISLQKKNNVFVTFVNKE